MNSDQLYETFIPFYNACYNVNKNKDESFDLESLYISTYKNMKMLLENGINPNRLYQFLDRNVKTNKRAYENNVTFDKFSERNTIIDYIDDLVSTNFIKSKLKNVEDFKSNLRTLVENYGGIAFYGVLENLNEPLKKLKNEYKDEVITRCYNHYINVDDDPEYKSKKKETKKKNDNLSNSLKMSTDIKSILIFESEIINNNIELLNVKLTIARRLIQEYINEKKAKKEAQRLEKESIELNKRRKEETERKRTLELLGEVEHSDPSYRRILPEINGEIKEIMEIALKDTYENLYEKYLSDSKKKEMFSDGKLPNLSWWDRNEFWFRFLFLIGKMHQSNLLIGDDKSTICSFLRYNIDYSSLKSEFTNKGIRTNSIDTILSSDSFSFEFHRLFYMNADREQNIYETHKYVEKVVDRIIDQSKFVVQLIGYKDSTENPFLCGRCGGMRRL